LGATPTSVLSFPTDSIPASLVAINRLPYRIRLTPARWETWRRRLHAAIELSQAVINRIGSDPDPERQRVAMIARVQIASARMVTGGVLQGAREIGRLMASGDPAVVQAFQGLAAALRGRQDAPGQITELGMLAMRASTLGHGDDRIARIAYDDSVRPLVADTAHRPVRWFARLNRPSGPGKRHTGTPD
jgi:hypothetical protein